MGLGAGQIVYAADLAGLRPGLYYKGASTTRNNTAALADDPDLSLIPLDPGFYSIKVLLLMTQANITAKFKTLWAYTGSWTTPVRGAVGPGGTNAGVPDVVTPVNLVGQTGTQVYSPAVSGAWVSIHEWADRVEVLTSGNFSVQWAQSVATVANTIVQPGSYVRVTKVDDL
jgi:hypothetical protein